MRFNLGSSSGGLYHDLHHQQSRDRSHMQTLLIYEFGFNQNSYTFTWILLIKIVVCSEIPWTKFINWKCFEIRPAPPETQRPHSPCVLHEQTPKRDWGWVWSVSPTFLAARDGRTRQCVTYMTPTQRNSGLHGNAARRSYRKRVSISKLSGNEVCHSKLFCNEVFTRMLYYH